MWGICGGLHAILLVIALFNLRNAILVGSKRESLLFLVFSVLGALCFCMIGALKASNFESSVIGRDPHITVLFSAGVFFYWICAIVFVKTLADLYTRKMLMLPGVEEPWFAFPLRLVIICNSLGAAAPTGCLFAPNASTVFAVVHYAMDATLSIIVLAFWNWHFSDSFLESLIKVDNFAKKTGAGASHAVALETNFERLIHWVRFVKSQAAQQAAFNVLVSSFMLWPFILRKASYQLSFSWGLAPVMVFGAMSVYNDSIGKKKSASNRHTGSTSADGKEAIEVSDSDL